VVDQWNLWNLSKMASHADNGWFLEPMSPGQSALVHENVDCTNPDCPQAYMTHRHVATPEQRERMQEYVTRWLTLKFEDARQRAAKDTAVRELRRMTSLPDRRGEP
jgi:hypothetical protein